MDDQDGRRSMLNTIADLLDKAVKHLRESDASIVNLEINATGGQRFVVIDMVNKKQYTLEIEDIRSEKTTTFRYNKSTRRQLAASLSKSGCSQSAIAKFLGCSQQTVSNDVKLANALGELSSELQSEQSNI